MADSPFATHFGTNYMPSDEELAQLRDILQDPSAEIAGIEDEIQKSLLHLKKLREAKDSREAATREYRALVSPFRRFPDDILRTVFLACLNASRNPTMANDEAPMLLTQVSHRWRQVAHSTPRLWAAIHVAVPPNFETSNSPTHVAQNERSKEVTELRLKAVQEWLDRSGACWLSISLHEWEGLVISSPNALKLLDGILQYRLRWTDISIATSSNILASFAKALDVEFPNLRALKLVAFGYPYFGLFKQCGKLVKAPNLKKLYLTGFVRDIPNHDIRSQAKWSTLTELTLESKTWGEDIDPTTAAIKNALRDCQSLVKLSLKFMTAFGPTNSAEPTDIKDTSMLVLPALTHLLLYEGTSRPFLLPYLFIPSLHTLEYMCCAPISVTEGHPPLLLLLRQAKLSLKTLVTSAGCFTATDLVNCLKLCPGLKSLAFRRLQMTPVLSDAQAQTLANPFLTRLTRPPIAESAESGSAVTPGHIPGEPLCPKLEEVEFTADVQFTEEGLRDFIVAKQTGVNSQVSKLKLVDVSFFSRRKQGINWSDVFKKEIEDGLRLTVRYPMAHVKSVFSLSHNI